MSSGLAPESPELEIVTLEAEAAAGAFEDHTEGQLESAAKAMDHP